MTNDNQKRSIRTTNPTSRTGGVAAATTGYDAAKAAQFTAYLLTKAPVGMERPKLLALLYIAERNSADEDGMLLFYDEHLRTPEGPVCANATRGIDGLVDRKIWSELVEVGWSGVRAKGGIVRQALDRLSLSDTEFADRLWARFGSMKTGEISDWSRNPGNIPEWHDPPPNEGARPCSEITPRDMAIGLGMEDPDDYVEGIEEVRSMRASNPFV